MFKRGTVSGLGGKETTGDNKDLTSGGTRRRSSGEGLCLQFFMWGGGREGPGPASRNPTG